MRTTPAATLKTMALLAAAMSVMLTALPAVADNGTVNCSPSTCTSPTVGPAYVQDVETR
jgi:hypothetical protein